MAFLVLLAIAFGAAAALLLLVVGFLEAPWPVLLGILALGMLATQRISTEGRAQQNEMNTFSDPAKQAQPKHSPTQKSKPDAAQATSGSTSGNSIPISSVVTYRGVADRGDHSPVLHSPVLNDGAIAQGLRYRGIAYGECKSENAMSDSSQVRDQAQNQDQEHVQGARPSSTRSSADTDIPLITPPSHAESAHASDSVLIPSQQNAASSEITPAPPKITVVEGTYRGRHWERVVAIPASDPSPSSNSSQSNPNGTVENE